MATLTQGQNRKRSRTGCSVCWDRHEICDKHQPVCQGCEEKASRYVFLSTLVRLSQPAACRSCRTRKKVCDGSGWSCERSTRGNSDSTSVVGSETDIYSSTPGTTDAYTEPAAGAGADLPSLQTNVGTHDLPQRTADTGLQIDFQGQAGLPEIDHDITTADTFSVDYMILPDDTDAWMSTTTMTTQPQIQVVLGYYTVLETCISLFKEAVDALPEHDKYWAVEGLDSLIAPYVRDIRARVRLLGYPWAE